MPCCGACSEKRGLVFLALTLLCLVWAVAAIGTELFVVDLDVRNARVDGDIWRYCVRGPDSSTGAAQPTTCTSYSDPALECPSLADRARAIRGFYVITIVVCVMNATLGVLDHFGKLTAMLPCGIKSQVVLAIVACLAIAWSVLAWAVAVSLPREHFCDRFSGRALTEEDNFKWGASPFLMLMLTITAIVQLVFVLIFPDSNASTTDNDGGVPQKQEQQPSSSSGSKRGLVFLACTVLTLVWMVAAFGSDLFKIEPEGAGVRARYDAWYGCGRADNDPTTGARQPEICITYPDLAAQGDCNEFKTYANAFQAFYVLTTLFCVVNVTFGVLDHFRRLEGLPCGIKSQVVLVILSSIVIVCSLLSWAIAIGFAGTKFCDATDTAKEQDGFKWGASPFMMLMLFITAIVQLVLALVFPGGAGGNDAPSNVDTYEVKEASAKPV